MPSRGIVAFAVLITGCATASSPAEDTPDAAPRPDAPVDAPIDAPAVLDAPSTVDAPPSGPASFLDDEAPDFAGVVLEEAAVAPWGGVESVAYYTGGLRARASNTDTIVSGSTAAWLDVENMSFTGVASISHGLDRAWGTGTPTGLGLTGGDTWSVALEGEMLLSAGTWNFHLLVDDHGFLEIAAPGTGSFSRVVASDNLEQSGSFTASTAGWHPIRMVVSEDGGDARLRLQATPPGGSRAAIARHLLRARVDHIPGLYMAAFDDSYMLGAHAVTIDGAAPVNRNWLAAMPADLGLTDAEHFSVRWAGQVRVDTEGAYVYRLVTDDGQRLWVDGELVLDAWDETSHDNMTTPLTLERGWHDLVVDHMEITGSARAQLTVASGPEGAGAALPLERLRPVLTRDQRYDTGKDPTDRPIPDLGSVESTIVLDAHPGAKVESLEVSWTFEHSYHGDLEIRLIAPDGSVALLRDNAGGGTSGLLTQRRHVDVLDAASVRGAWILRVTDTATLDTGTLRDFQITVGHRAGSAPIPALAAYESEPKDLLDTFGTGSELRYDDFSWLAYTPPGTSVQLRVRSADDQTELDATEWSPPILDPSDGAPPAPARRFFQYRIELLSDGDGAPSVDWVRLDYTVGAI